MSSRRVCLTPQLSGVGGMASFQARLAQGLIQRGVEVVYDLRHRPLEAALVIGGTRHLPALWKLRREGIPVVQRLNGMNWIHRRRQTGLRHYLRAEYGNWLLAFIRRHLASGIVYQSRFSQSWWQRVYGPARVPASVVLNAVDLNMYTPDGPHQRPTDCFRIQMVEGSLGGGYEIGLDWGVGLAQRLQALGFPVELVVAGRASPVLQAEWQAKAGLPLHFAGLVPPARIPALDRSAHLFYAADLHPACPNSVIEALACGLPVAALDTGAVAEVVTGEAGAITPYGGDPWRIDPPDLDGLANAAAPILRDQPRYRLAARQRAEAAFGLDAMLDGYMQALLGGV
jgi:glycosyltransferase involved in cell wall biosynthesis